MGYTHYFTRAEGTVPDARWTAFLADVNALLTPEVIARYHLTDETEMEDTRPRCTSEVVTFSAPYPDHTWETFHLPRIVLPGRGFNFCKTQRRTYDPVVCAVLILAVHHLGTFGPGCHCILGSDGTPADWQPGLDLLQTAALPGTLPDSL